MGQLKNMQALIAETQAALAEETVETSAGGGAVKVVMTGTQVCRSVEIDPGVFEAGDVELLQDAVLTALNQAIEASQALAAERLGPLAGGLGGGGLFG
jgi:DNA-binding YbaB/EbfC family protein